MDFKQYNKCPKKDGTTMSQNNSQLWPEMGMSFKQYHKSEARVFK
jgi:hypothetical protein